MHNNRAYALVRLNRLGEARQEVERGNKLDPNDAWTRSANANVLLAVGKAYEAEAELERALEIEDAAGLHFEPGVAMLCQGRAKDAEQHYDAGLAEASTDDVEVALRDLEFWDSRIDPKMKEMVNALRHRI